MFCMRGCLTIGMTLETLKFLRTGSNKEKNSRSKNILQIIKKNSTLKKRKRNIKGKRLLLVLRKALPKAKTSPANRKGMLFKGGRISFRPMIVIIYRKKEGGIMKQICHG